MRFDGIDCIGEFKVERVSSLPTPWSSEYEGRIVYTLDTDRLYIGIASAWRLITKTTDAVDLTATAAEINSALDGITVTAAQLNALYAGEVVVGIVEYTGNHTLVVGDLNKIINVNSASTRTLIVPSDVSDDFDTGFSCTIIRKGTGSVTIVDDGNGVTINSPEDRYILDDQWSAAVLMKIDDDVWVLSGDLR